MGECTKVNTRKAREVERATITDEMLLNRFMFFYTLRWLWKRYGHPAPELYSVLVNGNRTLYSRLLRQELVCLDDRVKSMSQLTGVSEKHFTGRQQLLIGNLTAYDWEDFFSHYRKNFRSAESKAAAAKIEKQLEAAVSKPHLQNNTFQTLNYFALNQSKKGVENLVQTTLLDSIRSIDNISRRDMSTLDLDMLKQARESLSKNLKHIDAIITLMEWENGKNRSN